MADKNFLLEHNLTKAYEKFMHLCNETTILDSMTEEEGQDDPNAAAGGADPNAMGEDPNAMGGGDPNAAGGDPNAMGGDPMAGDPNAMGGGDPNAMGGDPNAMGGDPMAGDPNAMGGDPMAGDPMSGADPMAGDPMAGGELGEMEQEEDEEVIDVEDLTKAQEKTSSRVNKLGRNLEKEDNKIENIMQMIQGLTQMIDKNNAEIARFQKEFEKRNPTPVEQMNLRSLDSFPFNQNPTNYWEKKATQPYVSGNRYEAYANNREPVANKEYTLTSKDVQDFNTNKIEDSFHISDDLRSTIEKIFDL